MKPFQTRLKKSTIYFSLLCVVVLVGSGLAVFSQPQPVNASSTLTFTPVADSYVNQSSPDKNYGNNRSIRIDGSPLVRSYLRFEVSGINGNINSVTLRIYANSSSNSGFEVHKVSDNAWQEKNVTFNNGPNPGEKVGTSPHFSSNSWVNTDVSSLLNSDGTVSIAVTGIDQTAVNLAAREDRNHKPQLLVELASQEPTATSTTPPNPTATRTNAPTGTGTVPPDPTATGTGAPTGTATIPPDPTATDTGAPTATSTTQPNPTATQSDDTQPGFPIRAAFLYPWFPEAWNQQGYNPFTNYTPSLGFYDSSSVSVIHDHISAMTYGNINAAILSWWGQGSRTDQRVATILGATPGSSNPSFRWSLYYENESQGDPSVTQIENDLQYIQSHYGSDASFLRVNGKFVLFVYADAVDGCGMADRWLQADNALGHPAYLVLKVFAGYRFCASQPDSWHQYSPAVATDQQRGFSYAISPGFWKKGEAPRLVRDLSTWTSNVRSMVAAGDPWQLVTTFNEWGEGTSVESAVEWASASGFGQYLDVLHDNGNGNPPPTTTPVGTATQPNPSATPTRSSTPPNPSPTATGTAPPPNPSATPTRTATPPNPSPTPTRTATPPNPSPTPTRTPTGPAPTATQPGMSPVTLTKGPDLLYSGTNTQMKLFWQWTSNTTFRVDWGTSPSYGSSSQSISAYDGTNHLYAYTISGLNPGTKYYYQVVMGNQYSAGNFMTAPADNATSVKFISYGDNRTNPSVQNTIAGLVNQLIQSDPSYQTFNLVCGDLVSNGDSDSTWTSEMFSPSFSNIRTELASLPYLPIMGNHEGSGSLFLRYFPQPYVAAGYWSFDYGPVHVVLMDQYVSYGNNSAEYNWVVNDLATTTKPWKVVMLHEPGWSANGGHPNNTTVQTVYQPVFEQYHVDLVIAGHNHYYARAMVNGIPELTIGTGGAPLYTPQNGQPNISFTYKGTGYARFAINGSTLTGWFIDSNGNTVDSFSVSH
jgi:hypothetical protein